MENINSNKWQLFNGDCYEVLKTIKSNSIDSMVTDPPAGIGLINLEWDSDKGGRDEWIKWLTQVMVECHRVLKPGAHAFVWALPRTSHWTATALEDAGFRVKDIVTHVFATGFPKSMAIDKAIDRARYTNTDEVYRVTEWIRNRRNELSLTNADLDCIAEVRGGTCHWTAQPPNGQPAIPTLERWQKLEKVLGEAPDWMIKLIKPSHELGEDWSKRRVTGFHKKSGGGLAGKPLESSNQAITETENEIARPWVGWGTALKPASEHWVLVQKPMSEHNLAANILKYETGGIHIDACRVRTDDSISSRNNLDFNEGSYLSGNRTRNITSIYQPHPLGRFPSNFVLSSSDDVACPARLLDVQSQEITDECASRFFKVFGCEAPFFYYPKPTQKEKGLQNKHPTVKPIALMKYLCKMITPPRGVILDPFAGSGTTGIAALQSGFGFSGIEKNKQYFEMAQMRLQKCSDSLRHAIHATG